MIGRYWDWTGGNIGALPLEFIVTAIAGWIFRKPIRRLWDRLHKDAQGELAEIRRIAEQAHRIAADTHQHVTGHMHPDAPPPKPRSMRGREKIGRTDGPSPRP